MTNTSNNEPSIYVACLASYNAGRLFGAWIDANQDAEEIESQVAAMLAKSPEPDAEEWAIHDSDDFCGIKISEHANFETVSALAAMLEEHGEPFAFWYEAHGGDQISPYDWPDAFEYAYHGEYNSEEDFAAELVESSGMLAGADTTLASYFDYASYAHDLFLDGFSSSRGSYGKLYVFADN